jgi:pyruvate dehydrogenase E2 component (dihydrolipoamide acetyltransferase)
MPALSPTMTEGTIVKWNKKVGEKVNAGEVMFEVETDKAVVGYEVQDEVYIAKILASEGTSKIPLGQPVAILVSKADRVGAFKDYSPEASSSSQVKSPSESSTIPASSASASNTLSTNPSSQSDNSRKFISPLAKNIAKQSNFDYSSLQGSGPNGRIVKNDVLAGISAKSEKIPEPSPVKTEKIPEDRAGYRDIPHSSMRKVTADRLLQSKQTIPHYYLSTDCKVDKLNDLRKKLTEMGDVKVSVNDLVIKAASLACLKVPEVNSTWGEGSIRVFDSVDISMAVQTPKGLITPIIKNAHTKRIGEIAKEAKELANTAKEGKLKPEQFIGGTFTISNLGMFGVKEFTAIINPPQACILAVGGSDPRVVQTDAGFAVNNFMTVTLSCDHRVVDGAVGANWLKAFRGYIEEPITMLL